MARAYTAELRDRVLRACERGGLSRARVAELFGVGESTLYRWRQTWRTEGRREARPRAGGDGGPRGGAPPPRRVRAAAGRGGARRAQGSGGRGQRPDPGRVRGLPPRACRGGGERADRVARAAEAGA